MYTCSIPVCEATRYMYSVALMNLIAYMYVRTESAIQLVSAVQYMYTVHVHTCIYLFVKLLITCTVYTTALS